MSKEKKLLKILSSYKSLAIAFSGGIDSSLLAVLAKSVLKTNLLLIFADTVFAKQNEREFISAFSRKNDFNLSIIRLNPLDESNIKKNDKQRCYYCKKCIMQLVISRANEHSIKNVADGLNLDDFSDYRPGIKASNELGILHPFVDAKLNKTEIRNIAFKYGLPFWNRPSSACLASRIPYNTQITEKNLKEVELAEVYMDSLGFSGNRVRHFGDTAKIEIQPKQLSKILRHRSDIIKHLKGIGFKNIYLDLEGYRQGALNEI